MKESDVKAGTQPRSPNDALTCPDGCGIYQRPLYRSCTPSVRGVLGWCARPERAGACESSRQTTPIYWLPWGGRVGCSVQWLGHRARAAWGWELARVYVSSTIADLTEERRAVLDWLRLARHQAVDSYLPDSDTVRDSCLDDVAACDLYVLIVGHRYGFQPPQDNPEGLSITQLEFRRAGECGIPRVALLRTSIPDVRLSDLQDPARAPLVLGFRDEVAGAGAAGGVQRPAGADPGAEHRDPGRAGQAGQAGRAVGRSGGGGPGAAAGAAAGVPGRAGGAAGRAGGPAGRG